MDDGKKILVRAYTPKEIRVMYGLSVRKWNRWLEKHGDAIGEPLGDMYSPKQVRIIFTIFDPPESDFSEGPPTLT